MVVFDNGVLQLIQFAPRSDGSVRAGGATSFKARELRTSPAYIAAPHVCFWVQDDVDFNAYVTQLENRSASLGFSQVMANRPVEVRQQNCCLFVYMLFYTPPPPLIQQQL